MAELLLELYSEEIPPQLQIAARSQIKIFIENTVKEENIKYKQDLKLFSNYLEDASNIDLDYLVQIEVDINPLLSTQLIFQLIYDDNAISRLQVREVFGVGVQLKLD